MPTDLMSALHRAISDLSSFPSSWGEDPQPRSRFFCQLVSDRRIGQHCIGISADLADDLTWCLGRNEQRLRRHNFVTWDILGDGGHILRGGGTSRLSSVQAMLPERAVDRSKARRSDSSRMPADRTQ
jgi:hypothetical protein